MGSEDPIVVLGAGCSGLSLALALRAAGNRTPIVLVDRRKSYADQGAWGFFDLDERTTWAALASGTWRRWRVGGVRHEGASHPYVALDSRVFYDTALQRLDHLGDVRLHLGEEVRQVQWDRGVVRTDSGDVRGSLVVDAMGQRAGLGGGEERPHELVRSWLGWEVEAERPVFDQDTAALMDFDALPATPDAVRFLTVLPTSSTRAWVRDTTLGETGLPTAQRRAALGAWLAARGTGAYELLREDRGRVTMTSHAYSAVRGARGVAVGGAAGAVRPWTGQAFGRIQRHCREVARALVGGRPLPPRVGPARHAAIDRVLLRALVQEPLRHPGRLEAIAGALPPAGFARFMAGASTPADEARVIAALPKLPLLVAVAARGGA